MKLILLVTVKVNGILKIDLLLKDVSLTNKGKDEAAYSGHKLMIKILRY